MPKPSNGPSKKDGFLRNEFKAYYDSMEETRKKLAQGIENAEAQGEYLTGASAYLAAMESLLTLSQMQENMFGQDGTGVLTEDMRSIYSEFVQEYLRNLHSIKNGLKDNTITDEAVREACQQFLDENEEAVSQEIRPYLNVKSQPQNWGITKEQEAKIPTVIAESKAYVENKSKERVRSSMEERSARGTGWREYPGVHPETPNPNRIPMSLQLSGDINELAAYYVKHENRLNQENKNYLKGRIGTIAYYDELEKTAKENPSKPVFDVKETGDGVQLEGYQNKYQYQTTGMGCWSCAYAMLLESRGVSLNQQIIRSFRPNAGTNDLAGSKLEQVKGIVADDAYSPLENADLTLKLLPNTAMRQVSLKEYNPTNPADVNAVKSVLKDTIKDAIRNHKSPVAITNGTHFLTIVGTDGDKFMALNSLGTNEGLLDDKELETYIRGNKQLSLTFLQDLSFDKKGKCTNMPEQFGVRYNDGKLIDIGENSDVLNRSGNTFDSSRQVGNIQVHESIYLPTSVPEKIYTKTAEKEVEAENVAQKQEEVKQEVPKVEPKVEVKAEEPKQAAPEPKVEGPQNQAPKAEVPQNQEPKAEEGPKVEGSQNQAPKAEEGPKVEEPQNQAPKAEEGPKVEEPQNQVPKAEETKQAAPEPKAPENVRDIAKEIQDEIDAARKQVGNIARASESENEDDKLADPAAALKQTVAMLLTLRSLLDAFEQSMFPNKEQMFGRLLDSSELVNDIAKSKNFNDFYSTLTRADYDKFAKGTPEESREVEDRLYKQYSDAPNRSVQSIEENKVAAKKNGTVKLNRNKGHELRHIVGLKEERRRKIARAQERKAEARAKAKQRAKAKEKLEADGWEIVDKKDFVRKDERVNIDKKNVEPKDEWVEIDEKDSGLEDEKVNSNQENQEAKNEAKAEGPKKVEPEKVDPALKMDAPKAEGPNKEEPKPEEAKGTAERKPEENAAPNRPAKPKRSIKNVSPEAERKPEGNAAPNRPAKPKRSIKNVSPAQRIMSTEIAEAHKQIGEVIKNGDSLADPTGALKMSVASLVAYRTMQDAYEHSNSQGREENFANIAKSREMVYDIAESRSFNDFFVTLKKEDLEKFSETDPATAKQVEDELYKNYSDAMEKAAEQKPEDLEVGKDWEVLKKEELDRNIDAEMDAKIVDAYKRIGDVLKDGEKENPDDRLANPEEALKYAVGSLLAYKTLEEAYIKSDVPNKDQLFGDMLDNDDLVRDIIDSKLFNDFYATLSKEDLAKFKGKENHKVDDKLYEEYSKFDKKLRKNVEEPKVEEAPAAEEAPKVEEAPAAEEAPKVEEAPAVDQPRVEEPVNPNVEQPVNQNEGQPVNPNAEQPVNPNEGQPLNQNAEQPVNPNAEQPVNPNAEQPVNQNAEQPVKQSVEQPVNQNDGQPVNPNGGQPENKKVEEPAPKKIEEEWEILENPNKKEPAPKMSNLKGLHVRRSVGKGPSNKGGKKKPEMKKFEKTNLFLKQVAANQQMLQERSKAAFENVKNDLTMNPKKVKNPDDALKENIARMLTYRGLLDQYNMAIVNKNVDGFDERMKETAMNGQIDRVKNSEFLDQFIKKLDETALESITTTDPKKAAAAEEKLFKRYLSEHSTYRKRMEAEQRKEQKRQAEARKKQQELEKKQKKRQVQSKKKEVNNSGPNVN